MTTEPALTIGSFTALAAAAITLLVAFGVEVTEEQQTAILGFVAVAGPIVAGFLTRKRVTPAP